MKRVRLRVRAVGLLVDNTDFVARYDLSAAGFTGTEIVYSLTGFIGSTTGWPASMSRSLASVRSSSLRSSLARSSRMRCWACSSSRPEHEQTFNEVESLMRETIEVLVARQFGKDAGRVLKVLRKGRW